MLNLPRHFHTVGVCTINTNIFTKCIYLQQINYQVSDLFSFLYPIIKLDFYATFIYIYYNIPKTEMYINLTVNTAIAIARKRATKCPIDVRTLTQAEMIPHQARFSQTDSLLPRSFPKQIKKITGIC